MLDPIEDILSLPFAWTAATRLPTQGYLLPCGPLPWPAVGQRIAEFTPVAFEDDEALVELRPELVLAECADLDALRRLLRVVYAQRSCGLAIVHGVVPPAVQAEVLGHTRDFAVVEAPGPRRAFDADASRTVAEIVRRRVYRTLIAHWRAAYGRHVAALTSLGEGFPVPSLELARPVMAPLSTIERVHIDGVLGLWLPARPKPAARLGISHARLRRATARPPEALSRAASVGSGPLRALVVEDDHYLARTLELLLRRQATRAGRTVDVEVVGRSDLARERIQRDGVPDLLCVDVGLEDPWAGVRLLEWLRAGGGTSVVLGKSGIAEPESVRALWRLGAYGVWTGEGPDALAREVGALFDTLEDVVAIRGAAAQADALATALEAQVGRGLLGADLVRRAREARSIVSGLEADLADRPDDVGPDEPLESVRVEAGRRALELAGGNRAAAARMLGIDVGTLGRLVRD